MELHEIEGIGATYAATLGSHGLWRLSRRCGGRSGRAIWRVSGASALLDSLVAKASQNGVQLKDVKG